jgi:hypothetical protein
MMKKILSCVVIVILGITLVSCKGKANTQQEESQNTFDIKIATNIMETYMQYLKNEDLDNAKKLYSKELSEKQKDIIKSDLKIEGFKLDEINEVGRSGLFKVRVTRSTPNKSMSILDMYNIKVEKQENEYKINEINSTTEKEAFIENEGIRIRQKNNVKTNLVVDLAGIPNYVYPKDDTASISKAQVPRKSFGMINFAYSGEKIAVSTFDKDSYIGVIKIDETMATQGGGGSGGGGGGGQGGGTQGGGGGGQGGQKTLTRETPVGKEITNIDMLKDVKLDLMNFSLDEKFILVQYDKTGVGKYIRVYDTDSGEMIPVEFEKKFPPDKVDVLFSSFGKDVLNIEVRSKNATGKEQADLIGKWQINLKDNKMQKL